MNCILRGMNDAGYRETPRRPVIVSTTRRQFLKSFGKGVRTLFQEAKAEAKKGPDPFSVHQVVGDGVVHQLRVRLHVHLAQDARAVGADGIGAEEELVGDLAHGLAGSDHPHHLVLAVRERLVQRLAAVVLELERELLAQARRDVAPAAGDLADGAHQLLGGAFLRQVTCGARLERAHRVAVLGVHAEDQHRAAGIALAQLLDQLQAVLARHVVVEHGDFPRHLARELHHFLAVLRLADHVEVGLDREHLPQSLAHDRMIVCDDDFHDLLLARMQTSTRAPSPPAPVIFTSPPKSSARSCMPSRPSDFLPFRSASAMPTPLSATSRVTFSSPAFSPAFSPMASSTSMRVAREWRATLVRISWKMRNIVVATSMSSLVDSGGSLTRARMPVRFWNSFACQPTAATRPMSSSISGRSPVAILRTVCTLESMSLHIESVFSMSGASFRRRASQVTSIFRPVSTWPSSSWISRAMCALSSSLTEIRCAARRRSLSSDSRSRSLLRCSSTNTATFDFSTSGTTGFIR